MVLIGNFADKHSAVQSFEKLFGEWYTIGASVADGLDNKFPGANLLLSPALIEQITDWTKTNEGPYFTWHSQIHFNYS